MSFSQILAIRGWFTFNKLKYFLDPKTKQHKHQKKPKKFILNSWLQTINNYTLYYRPIKFRQTMIRCSFCVFLILLLLYLESQIRDRTKLQITKYLSTPHFFNYIIYMVATTLFQLPKCREDKYLWHFKILHPPQIW